MTQPPSGPVMLPWLKPLLEAMQSAQPQVQLRGMRQGYNLTFGLTATLGLLLGLLGWWLGPVQFSGELELWLLLLAAVLAGLVIWLTGRTLRSQLNQSRTPHEQRTALLGGGLGLATAPAIPWLLGCAVVSHLPLALSFAASAGVFYGLGWWLLGRWQAAASGKILEVLQSGSSPEAIEQND